MLLDQRLKTLLTTRLQGFARARVDCQTEPLRPAAVAVVVVDEGLGADLPGVPKPAGWSEAAALLLTRRSRSLRRHAGQWALPGGRVDPGESDEQTARRELQEELGLSLAAEALLGQLDSIPTRSGYLMAPVVFWGGAIERLYPDPDEVASVHRIPLSELLREDAPMLDPPVDGVHPVLRMPIGSRWIAAPTASILYQFRELLRHPDPVRVAHFGQPKFTWR